MDGLVWANLDDLFELRDGSWGNPGCDGCGMYDAVVRIDGEYMCEASYEEWLSEEED